MSAYIEQYCTVHKEWDMDVDNPGPCPKCKPCSHCRGTGIQGMKAYDVLLNGEEIDTIFYTSLYRTREEREREVKDSLVNHDGYDSNIEVKEER